MSALAILGIGALESGWGTSNIAKKTNNIWGYGATNVNPEGNAHRYGQMSQGATQFASEFMKTYYNGYGAKSINSAGTGNNPKGMGYAYTDGGAIDSSWATQVSSIMGQLYNTAKGVSGSNTGNSSSNSSRSYLNRLSYANNSNASSGGFPKDDRLLRRQSSIWEHRMYTAVLRQAVLIVAVLYNSRRKQAVLIYHEQHTTK